MKITNQVIFLGLLIFAVCLISLMPFSTKEGYFNTYDDYYQQLDNLTISANNKTKTGSVGSIRTGNLNARGSSFDIMHKDWTHDYNNKHYQDEIYDVFNGLNEQNNQHPITNNTDFLVAVTKALTENPDQTADMNAIYKIETRLAGLNTKNARNLLSEMGNPNIYRIPRAFLQYMNWYGTNCPVDSNVCVNAV